MITSLQLHNFKCFAHSPRFEFSRINLLTGLNGCGKSTVLQALLLLGQSVNRNTEMRNLYLN
ncbi:MAG: AAA family ATPase [Succinivibrio sp.]|nr:AAA family ATPase [Succinivibrio sp.]